MEQWFPKRQPLAPSDLYAGLRWGPASEPALAIGMVVGIDGGVAVGGTSSGLGGDGDWAAFKALRDAADVILVGAGTARAEGYGPPRHRDEVVAARVAAGRFGHAQLALVTRSGRLDPTLRVFEDADRLPVVVTCRAAPTDRLGPIEDLGVEVLRFGDQEVDLRAALAHLGRRGDGRVLCEGGPTLNRAVFAAGLVDEVFVTLAPTVTGAEVHLLSGGLEAPVRLRLRSVVHAEDELLLRYEVLAAA